MYQFYRLFTRSLAIDARMAVVMLWAYEEISGVIYLDLWGQDGKEGETER